MGILDNVGAAAPLDENREYQCEDDLFSTEYPGLYDFLAKVRNNGKYRKAGKMLIYYEPERVQILLIDKNTKSCAWHASKSISEALESLERRLQAGSVEWKYDKRATN